MAEDPRQPESQAESEAARLRQVQFLDELERRLNQWSSEFVDRLERTIEQGATRFGEQIAVVLSDRRQEGESAAQEQDIVQQAFSREDIETAAQDFFTRRMGDDVEDIRIDVAAIRAAVVQE